VCVCERGGEREEEEEEEDGEEKWLVLICAGEWNMSILL
jgi:hypothetical protein